MSKKKTGCIACAIGCGIFILLGLLFVVMGSVWISQKGEFDQTASILSSESDCFIQLKLNEEEEFLIDFIQKLSAQANKDNPVFKKFPALEEMNNAKTKSDIKELMPLRVELQTLPANEEFQLSVGFSAYHRIASIAYYFAERNARENDLFYEEGQRSYIEVKTKKGKSVFMSLDESIFYLANTRNAMSLMLTGLPVTQADHHDSVGLKDLNLDSFLYGFLTRSAIRPEVFLFLGVEDLTPWDWFSEDVLSRVALDMRANSNGEELLGTLIFDLTDSGYVPLVREKMDDVIEAINRKGTVKIHVNWEELPSRLTAHFSMYDFQIPTGKTDIGNGVHIEVNDDGAE
ncbi:MAG: hypothetical protein CR997_02185 [Acidobacteria bacterium]|nr:MAG: hypothetical protein CR997_02185 [Acidobacteriota bacterium]